LLLGLQIIDLLLGRRCGLLDDDRCGELGVQNIQSQLAVAFQQLLICGPVGIAMFGESQLCGDVLGDETAEVVYSRSRNTGVKQQVHHRDIQFV
jgi:hypothetical protein